MFKCLGTQVKPEGDFQPAAVKTFICITMYGKFFCSISIFFPQRHPSSDPLGEVPSVAGPSRKALTLQLSPHLARAGVYLGGAGAAPATSAHAGFPRAPFQGRPAAQCPRPCRSHAHPGRLAAAPAPARRSSGTAQRARPWHGRAHRGSNTRGQEEGKQKGLNTAPEVEQTGGLAVG